ncbi:MAG: exonuclease domain-containing protein, partial [Halothiobacillus sp.]|nr:exonuclease domain-containing protein [Halothiobacillus sp.]
VVDVETTGLSPWRNDRIVEIAVVLMSSDGTIHQEYETLVNPDRDLGPSRIHRITAGEILHAPKFSGIAGDVAELLSRTYILAGHNVSFDRNFLIKEYERVGITMPDIPVFCTCQLLGRNNLAACCQELDVVFEGEPHRAISDARATACLVRRLIADDPAILEGYPQSSKEWPVILPRKTTPVSRDHAQEKLQEPPKFLQRILSKSHHDTDATTPDVVAYLALVDRILEDRVINVDEENILVDAVANWGLSTFQVKMAHQTYIHNLAVHALADGVVTDAERSDLHQVARLLGHDDRELDHILESAAAQLRTTNSTKVTGSPGQDLHGKRVCFTGELQSRINGEPITRDIAETLAEQAGLVVANSVTKKLDLLVVADPNTQSGKAKKARQYGTRILADSVFWRMIGIAVE